MGDSIFKFADKFGYESPFGDWLKKEANLILAKIVSVRVTKKTDSKFSFMPSNVDTKTDFLVNVEVLIQISGSASRVHVSVGNQAGFAEKQSNSKDIYSKLFVVKIPKSLVHKDMKNSKEFQVKVTIIDQVTNKISDTQTQAVTIESEVNSKKEDNDLKNSKTGKCMCNRNLTQKEFDTIIHDLRKSETIEGSAVNVKLFQSSNCKLPDSDKTAKAVLRQLNATFYKYGIDKCIRKIHFISQIYHESARLQTTEEFNTEATYAPYIGRGVMQLTHITNYKLYSAYYSQDANVDRDFVTNYSLLSTSLYHAFNSGGWYWKQGVFLSYEGVWQPPSDAPDWVFKDNPSYPKKEIKYKYLNNPEKTYYTVDLNEVADDDLGDVVSYLVNGGGNGLENRRDYVKTLKSIFDYDNCINNKE